MFIKSIAIAASIHAMTGGLSSTTAQVPPTTSKFAVSTLLLPNGKTLTTEDGGLSQAIWNHVRLAVSMIGVPANDPYGQSVVGNHSQIVSQRWIDTPYGRAWFALNERTAPAASGSAKASYEYWVAMARSGASPDSRFDYCVEAFVAGDRAHAKDVVMSVVNQWIVPFRADASAKPPVPVAISPSPGNIKLADAVQSYLVNVSDPTVYQRFTILKVTYSGKHFGLPVWIVKLNVQHQPGRTSAFINGVNDRYVGFMKRDGKYYVFSLATGR